MRNVKYPPPKRGGARRAPPNRRRRARPAALLAALGLAFCALFLPQLLDLSIGLPMELPQEASPAPPSPGPEASPAVFTLSNLPAYAGEPWVELYGNTPAFPEEDKAPASFERYSPLDALERPGTAYACVGRDTMPTQEREGIGMIRPAGWHTIRYDFIDGKYLYNRCHLIGFQLTGENANLQNLITGTRYLNVQGMLPFEEQVADYVRDTGNHVLYRVTPIYEGEELLARGLTLEGWSVEDEGAGVCFYAYAYNVQPGVGIDYATGESWAQEGQGPGPLPPAA